MKSKIWLPLMVVLMVVAAWQWHKAYRERSTHYALQEVIRTQQRRLERLAAERDSITRVLHRREAQYFAAADSLNAAIDRLQTRQTQNREQYENTRHRVDLMPDNELYRFVSDYISRYADSLQR